MKINEVTSSSLSNLLRSYSRTGSFYIEPEQKIKSKIDPSVVNIPAADSLVAQPEPRSQPSVESPLHPDVSVISSYPLRLRYKNGDYVLDTKTNQWLTVTGKKLSPTLSAFLQTQADKL